MLKLLYIPTGNIFTLPDSEALKIKQTDRGNYKILDCKTLNEIKDNIETNETIQESNEKEKSIKE